MTEHRITYLRPAEVENEMGNFSAAWIPCGVVEWHSHHLPLGTDGLKVEKLCEQFANRFGGLVFPVLYAGSCLLQYPFSFGTDSEILRLFLEDYFLELERQGFQYIFIVSGHYSGEQLIILSEAAETHMQKGQALVFATREAGPIADSSHYFDHAAIYETSIMMALYPSLVDKSQLDSRASLRDFSLPDSWRNYGLMGNDPRDATEELGKKILEEIFTAWDKSVKELRSPGAREYLQKFYQQQRDFLAEVLPYYKQYFLTGSCGYETWEEAWDNYYLTTMVTEEEREQRRRWFRTLWRNNRIDEIGSTRIS